MGSERGFDRPRFALTGLLVLLLGAAGALPRWPGLVQEVGLPPLDLFADLRVLVTRAPSYPVFGVGLAASLAGRSALLMLATGAASRRRFLFALRFYLAALIPAYVAAGLVFSADAALYHWYFWAGMALTLLTFLVLGAVPWSGRLGLAGGLAAAVRRRLRFRTLAGYLVALTVIGALAHAGGSVFSVLLVPVSAAVTGSAARRLARGPVRRRPVRRFAPVVAVVLALVVLVLALRGGPPSPSPPPRPGSLFVVAGLDSASGFAVLDHLEPRTLGFSCEQTYYFSYLGPGPGAPQRTATCPVLTGRRYKRRDTQRPLAELVAAFRSQVATLPPPVTVVTHSQAAWIAWAAVASDPRTPVRTVILLAPFPKDAVAYPPDGRDGPGRVGADVLRLIAAYARSTGVSTFDPDKPLARELLATPGAIQGIFSRPLPPGVRAVSIEPLWDLPLMPEGRVIPHAENACPIRTTHVGLPTSPAMEVTANRFLDGQGLPGCGLGASWLSALTAAWGVPPSDT